jgi:hypothetical protein
MFFLKIATYKSTSKILYTLKGTKEITKTPLSPSNNFFIKIDPVGIEFAMMIPRPHDFDNVVAGGHNLCMQLRSQNCEFAASGSKNCLAANKNHHHR